MDTKRNPEMDPLKIERRDRLRIAFYGAGAMAREVAQTVALHGHDVVAAYDVTVPGEPLGEVHVRSFEELVSARPDVVVHATPRDSDLRAQLLELVEAGTRVISVSGIAHLAAIDPDAADAIAEAARQHGVAVVGTGINPGFVLDLVPIFFAGASLDVRAVAARRTFDLSPYGEAVHDMYGVGLAPPEFEARIADGRIGLHREIVQSVHMIAGALGIEVEAVQEEKIPLVEEDRVVGFRHICRGLPAIELEMTGRLDLDAGGTTVTISGDPDIVVEMGGGLTDEGGRVVAARVVNLLPWVMTAPAGLRSPTELPVTLRAERSFT